MHGSLEGDTVHIPSPGRERFYDNRGYGNPRGDGLSLAPVEAAHLLFRGDLETVDEMGFRSFLSTTETLVPFLVYKDLRERGFYLSPARKDWIDSEKASNVDFVVYPRGKGPWGDAIAYRVRVVGERDEIPVSALNGTLAVVDEESEITYFSVESPDMTGTTDHDLPENVKGTLLSDRVVLWEPPATLYERAFYGQPLDTNTTAPPRSTQCSLIESAYLADQGIIQVDAGLDGVLERGRVVEGERFDRRRASTARCGTEELSRRLDISSGPTFERIYDRRKSVDDLGHSEHLVRVLPRDHSFSPRNLSLDVRLAHGVRKRMVFALTDASGDIDWRSVSRLTP